jgi:Flp pilus assembly protein TadD
MAPPEPCSPSNLLDEAAELYKQGDYSAAEPLLRRHVAENPDDARAAAQLAAVLVSIGGQVCAARQASIASVCAES